MHVCVETERLLLRPFATADGDNLYHLHNDPDVMHFLNGGTHTPREVIECDTLPLFLGHGFYAAIEKSTGAFLGWFALHPTDGRDPSDVELGYRLHKAAWGKGYATEGSRALIHLGFTLAGARRVWGADDGGQYALPAGDGEGWAGARTHVPPGVR